jgi:SAM-dependent methyltransferase
MITDDTAWLMIEACRLLKLPTRRLSICELGNQHAGWNLHSPVKPIMEWLGARHTSIDLNGLDGALKHDLAAPLPDTLLGQFDLVTNAGTTEHVCTSNDFRDQWQALRSIHDLTKPQAAIMHVIPDEHGWHCGCGYAYTRDFLPALATACGYSLIHWYPSRSDAHHIAALLLKHAHRSFPDFDEFRALGGILQAKVANE